jgi:hypothetical protein
MCVCEPRRQCSSGTRIAGPALAGRPSSRPAHLQRQQQRQRCARHAQRQRQQQQGAGPQEDRKPAGHDAPCTARAAGCQRAPCDLARHVQPGCAQATISTCTPPGCGARAGPAPQRAAQQGARSRAGRTCCEAAPVERVEQRSRVHRQRQLPQRIRRDPAAVADLQRLQRRAGRQHAPRACCCMQQDRGRQQQGGAGATLALTSVPTHVQISTKMGTMANHRLRPWKGLGASPLPAAASPAAPSAPSAAAAAPSSDAAPSAAASATAAPSAPSPCCFRWWGFWGLGMKRNVSAVMLQNAAMTQ